MTNIQINDLHYFKTPCKKRITLLPPRHENERRQPEILATPTYDNLSLTTDLTRISWKLVEQEMEEQKQEFQTTNKKKLDALLKAREDLKQIEIDLLDTNEHLQDIRESPENSEKWLNRTTILFQSLSYPTDTWIEEVLELIDDEAFKEYFTTVEKIIEGWLAFRECFIGFSKGKLITIEPAVIQKQSSTMAKTTTSTSEEKVLQTDLLLRAKVPKFAGTSLEDSAQ